MRPPEWVTWSLTVAAIVPLVACILVLLRRSLSHDAGLLALGCCVSLVADLAGAQLQAAHRNTWWLGYCYLPIQFAMFLLVVGRQSVMRWTAIGLLLVVAGCSALRGPLSEPELVVATFGGLLVAVMAWRTPWRWPMGLYGAATIPGVLWMTMVPVMAPTWGVGWWLYQAARLAALGVLTWTIGGLHGCGRDYQTGQLGDEWDLDRLHPGAGVSRQTADGTARRGIGPRAVDPDPRTVAGDSGRDFGPAEPPPGSGIYALR